MSDDANYERLKAAVVEFDAAEKAQLDHIATWGHWYERDEIVTVVDRISEDKIHKAERLITKRLSAAIDGLIFAARTYTK
jgi:hypothetical protein